MGCSEVEQGDGGGSEEEERVRRTLRYQLIRAEVFSHGGTVRVTGNY